MMKSRNNGFAAIAAIFIVVVLAGLSAFMVSISNSQQISSANDYKGTSAYLAARAGAEWQIDRLKSNPVCPADYAILTFGEYYVTVTCQKMVYADGDTINNTAIFDIQTLASFGHNVGSIGYVERGFTVQYEISIN